MRGEDSGIGLTPIHFSSMRCRGIMVVALGHTQ
jgi:hypothetical protein